MTGLSYASTAERPDAHLWIFDDDGTLIDFSTGTFSLKIGHAGTAAILTKSTGITGAAGAGVEPSGTPNVVIVWTAGELALTPGRYSGQLTWTVSSKDRVFTVSFQILDVVT